MDNSCINYNKDSLEKLRFELLAGGVTHFKELDDIVDYLTIFQKKYFMNSTVYLNQLINFLTEHKTDMKKLNNDFLSILLEIDLLKFTVPTDLIFNELLILFNKNCVPFDSRYYESMLSIIKTLDKYNGPIIDEDLSRYYIVFRKKYNEFLDELDEGNSEYLNMSYDVYISSRFVMTYAFYYSKDPSIIIEFINKYISNYAVIKDFCELNQVGLSTYNDIFYYDNLVDYVLSFDTDRLRKVILR